MNGFESALGHVGHGPLGPNSIWSDRRLTLARISELAFLPHRATERMLAWWCTQLDRRRFVYDTYTVSQKSEPPKHFATAAANLHRFKWNFIHTRRHLFLSSTSNFIRIPCSVYEMFNYFKLLVLKSMARITETRCWDNSCCQPFVQSLVTSSPSSKTVPSPPCPWDGCAIVSWDTRLHQPPNRVEHFDCSGWHQLRWKLMTCG